jgi:phosphoribosylglycinamide formyltransferase-1
MDDGPIIAQAAVPVLAADTADTLAARVLGVEHELYPHALAMFASGRVRIDGERVLGAPVPAKPSAPLIWPPLA